MKKLKQEILIFFEQEIMKISTCLLVSSFLSDSSELGHSSSTVRCPEGQESKLARGYGPIRL